MELFSILLFLVGIALFFHGFTILRKKRIIDNTPASKIGSVAIGRAELCGTAVKKFALQSPLTKTDCVYYRYKIEKEERGSKGSTRWVPVENGVSTVYFGLQDETGAILIEPKGAKVNTPEKFRTIEIKDLTKYRYTESRISAGEQVYVLGTITKLLNPIDDHKQKLIDALRSLKGDRARLMKYDTNRDGTISSEEWDVARTEMEQKLLEQELAQQGKDASDLVVGAGAGNTPFIISSLSEREASVSLGLRSVVFFAGGALLMIIACISMLRGQLYK
jgi:hypothetical protein